jgi:hypothetical protein
MAELDDVEDPKAGAPAQGQDDAPETEAKPEGEQPDGEQAESIEDKVARLEQQLADERRRKKQAQGTTRQLQARLDQLETNVGSLAEERARSQRAQVLQSVQQQVAAAEASLAEAHEAGESRAVAAAQRALAEAVTQADRVKAQLGDDDGDGHSQRRPRQAETRQPQQQAEMPAATKAWLAKNSWYGNQADARDRRDSLLAHRIMEMVAADTGLTVNDAEFWTEVDTAVKDALPHRFAAKPATGARPAPNSAGAGRAVAMGRQGDIDGIPAAVLEVARQAGKPVHDPAFRKSLLPYVKDVAATTRNPR